MRRKFFKNEEPAPKSIRLKEGKVNYVTDVDEFKAYIIELYQDVMDRTRYTTLSDLANFWEFAMQRPGHVDDIDLREAWDVYKPDLDALATKYSGGAELGGNCCILGMQIVKDMRAKFARTDLFAKGRFGRRQTQLHMHLMPSFPNNQVGGLPIDEPPFIEPWPYARKAMQYSHVSGVVPFQRPDEDMPSYLKLEPGQGMPQHDFVPSRRYFQANNRGLNDADIAMGLKSQADLEEVNHRLVRARTEFNVFRSENKFPEYERFSGNLLTGVLRLVDYNPDHIAWAASSISNRSLTQRSHDHCYQVKFDMDALINNPKGATTIGDGKDLELITNEQFLKFLLIYIRKRFNQPEEASETLEALFKYRQKIIRELYYPGASDRKKF